MISCAEFDAGQAYLISNRYEEKKNNKGFIYWYGAIKTSDAAIDGNGYGKVAEVQDSMLLKMV